MADPMAQARAFIDSIFGAVGKVTRCFICVADGLLPSDDERVAEHARVREFYNHNSVPRHFISSHLKELHGYALGSCLISYGINLRDISHLQNHAEGGHGIRLAIKAEIIICYGHNKNSEGTTQPTTSIIYIITFPFSHYIFSVPSPLVTESALELIELITDWARDSARTEQGFQR